jgi:hypothetical protein
MNITVITLVGFAVTILSIYLVGYLNRPKPDYVFSFEDTMGIHKVPVVSFEHNGQTVNFIIDSGAAHSVLNISSIDSFKGELLENTGGAVYGIDGNLVNTRLARIEIMKNGHTFQDIFQILAIPGIDKMNAQNGIEVHGILGSTFLKKYQFIINYKHLRAYTNG